MWKTKTGKFNLKSFLRGLKAQDGRRRTLRHYPALNRAERPVLDVFGGAPALLFDKSQVARVYSSFGTTERIKETELVKAWRNTIQTFVSRLNIKWDLSRLPMRWRVEDALKIGTVPNWGYMQDGVCWEVATLTQLKRPRKNSAYWPSPVSANGWQVGINLDKLWFKKNFTGISYGALLSSLLYECLKTLRRYPTPEFEELLMWWPEGWTSLEKLDKVKFEQWLSLNTPFHK